MRSTYILALLVDKSTDALAPMTNNDVNDDIMRVFYSSKVSKVEHQTTFEEHLSLAKDHARAPIAPPPNHFEKGLTLSRGCFSDLTDAPQNHFEETMCIYKLHPSGLVVVATATVRNDGVGFNNRHWTIKWFGSSKSCRYPRGFGLGYGIIKVFHQETTKRSNLISLNLVGGHCYCPP